MMKLRWALCVSVFAVAVPACADLGPYDVGDISFGFFPPYRHDQPNVPTGQTIYGFHLTGDWTPTGGDAWSAFFRLYGTAPTGGISSALDYGGTDNPSPYRFDASRYLAFPEGVPSGGDWQLSFTSTFPGSTAALAGTQVTLLEAEVASYADTTVAAPEWDRPKPGFDGISTYGPVRYHVQPFTVAVTGRYDIYSVQTFDGFVLLYEGSFDPTAPLVGGLAENDDGRLGEVSSDIWRDRTGQALTLSAGTTYYLVTTGFEDGEAGDFTNYIGGVGAVTLVPEANLGMALLAIAGLGLRRR